MAFNMNVGFADETIKMLYRCFNLQKTALARGDGPRHLDCCDVCNPPRDDMAGISDTVPTLSGIGETASCP